MPFTLALAGLLAGLAGTGASIGETIANSGTPKPPTAPVTPPPNAQQLLQQRQVVGTQDSNLQESGSGDLGSNFLAQMAPYLAGISGQPGANAAGAAGAGQAFSAANSQPTNAAVNNQQVNLSDFINTNT